MGGRDFVRLLRMRRTSGMKQVKINSMRHCRKSTAVSTYAVLPSIEERRTMITRFQYWSCSNLYVPEKPLAQTRQAIELTV
eukprot:12637921-Ditylum_brightwellii.AAC.1